jgi:DNA repair protein RadC
VNIHLTADELPREKLMRDGPEVLSDVELLAIFLGTGTAGQSVLMLAGQLLKQFGDLRGLLEADAERITAVPGMGPEKYASLIASQELSVRCVQSAAKRRDVLTDLTMSRRYRCAKLRHQEREVFACLYLDNQHRLISYEELFFGTIDSVSIHPGEVVKMVLFHNAAAMIFAHNHPSGVAESSSADKRITERLQSALMLIDVRVLDYMIVGDVEVVSFAERGWL